MLYTSTLVYIFVFLPVAYKAVTKKVLYSLVNQYLLLYKKGYAIVA